MRWNINISGILATITCIGLLIWGDNVSQIIGCSGLIYLSK